MGWRLPLSSKRGGPWKPPGRLLAMPLPLIHPARESPLSRPYPAHAAPGSRLHPCHARYLASPSLADLRKRRSSGASAGSERAALLMAKVSWCAESRGHSHSLLKSIPGHGASSPPTPCIRQSGGAAKALRAAIGWQAQADLTLSC